VRINKSLVFIYISFCVTSYVFSFNHQKKSQDFYKKRFIVGTQGYGIQDIIKQGRDGLIREAFFTPFDDIQGLLLALIREEKTSIKMTAYSFRNEKIVDALKQALKRGVKVELVFDPRAISEDNDQYAYILEENGAKIFVYKAPEEKPSEKITGIMHNKFIVFGCNIYKKSLVWTGSYNFTVSNNDSQNNVVISSDIRSVKCYSKAFDFLKNRVCGVYNSDRYICSDQEDDSEDSSESNLESSDDKGEEKKIFILRKRKRVIRRQKQIDDRENEFQPQKKKRKIRHATPRGVLAKLCAVEQNNCKNNCVQKKY